MNGEPIPSSVSQPKTNKLAATSLVLGILSLVLCVIGIVFAIPGLICGFLGMKRVQNSGGTQKGHGVALAGTVISGVGLVIFPVVGLMAAIAVPNFIKAREASMRAACVANLMTIDGAKATWALENKKLATDIPKDSDLFGPGKYIKEKPRCLKGGIYSLNRVDKKPACSVSGHELF
jgi:hypothetical protein